MNRREMILRTAAAAFGLGLTSYSFSGQAAVPKVKKVLFFSKSSGYEHSVIKRKDGQPAHAEKILAQLGPENGIEFSFSKDGSLFTPAYLKQFDAFFFYTTGDLTAPGGDKNPPMTPAGKEAFLDAIKSGKGFIGTHSATDTFHTNEPDGFDTKNRKPRYQNYGDKADPYVRMIGAEFIMHGKQQVAKMRVASPKFPGMPRADVSLLDEWYSLKDFAKDLHVLLVQETEGMTGAPYQRPPFPATWARMHGQGRVFYSSMGHREDVWENPMFQELIFGGINWAVGNVDADVTPNIDKVTPKCAEIPPEGT